MSFLEFCIGMALGLSLGFLLSQQFIEALILGIAGIMLVVLTMGDEEP
jgi:hypothetical protein